MSVAVMSDMVYTFPITAADSTAVIYQFPHPLAPCVVGLGETLVVFYNAAFGGAVKAPSDEDFQLLSKNFAGTCERFRINAQSVTAELIAPALSDQGTVTSACLPFTKQRFYKYVKGSTSSVADNPIDFYDRPTDESTWLLGASAYTAKAREGVYQPLKLTSFKYRDSNTFVISTSVDASPPFTAAPEMSAAFPFFSLAHTVECTSKMFGATMFRGMAASTALRVRVRQVCEMVVKQGTTYAPLAEPAPPPDSTALKMYFEVSSRMKDGYPASYNDLGKLLDVIKRIGKSVLPFVEPALAVLSAVPGPVGSVARGVTAAKAAVGQAVAAGRAVKAARARKKVKTVVSSRRPLRRTN